MGAVYKARQRELDRLVAVKVLPPEVGRDPAFAERFTREARAMARLNHPNIVAVYDFGRTSGLPSPVLGKAAEVEGGATVQGGGGELFYFVMEFVDGVNLRHAIQSGGIDPKQALAIVPQICDALQFAHDEGVVHRDIKPENILIDKRGRVKIADFGLAKLLGQEAADHGLTATQQVMGTIRYMAPEQMEGSKTVDHRADIYSLGVVFYELLTGELPIGHFAPPSKMVEIDVRLDEVVLRALEKKPEQRYQHASEVKTDVEGITRHERPSAVPSAASEIKTEEVIRSSPGSVPSRFARLGLSGKLLALGGLAGLIAVFLPLVSMSIQMGGSGGFKLFEMPGMFGRADHPAMNVNQTVLVAEDWRGKVGMAGYLAAVVLAFVLYPPQGSAQKALCWAGVGTGLLVALLALWALAAALNSGSANMLGVVGAAASPGVGGLLNVVAGLVVAVGGLLKAREEKLFGGEHIR